MEELVNRRDPSDFKSNEEALADFRKHYMPKAESDLVDPSTGIRLTPSPQGRDCLGNGEWPGYECCCDECDHYPTCFLDWKVSYINLDGEKPDHISQEQWDGLKQVFDEIYEDEARSDNEK